jgi:hypothetical protein
MHPYHVINSTILDGIWPPHFFVNMTIKFFCEYGRQFSCLVVDDSLCHVFLFGSTDEICSDGNETCGVPVPVRFCT